MVKLGDLVMYDEDTYEVCRITSPYRNPLYTIINDNSEFINVNEEDCYIILQSINSFKQVMMNIKFDDN